MIATSAVDYICVNLEAVWRFATQPHANTLLLLFLLLFLRSGVARSGESRNNRRANTTDATTDGKRRATAACGRGRTFYFFSDRGCSHRRRPKSLHPKTCLWVEMRARPDDPSLRLGTIGYTAYNEGCCNTREFATLWLVWVKRVLSFRLFFLPKRATHSLVARDRALYCNMLSVRFSHKVRSLKSKPENIIYLVV